MHDTQQHDNNIHDGIFNNPFHFTPLKAATNSPFSPPPQILHFHCFQFLMGITVVPKEIKENSYAKLFFLGGGGW